jgi:hypothetical protein
VVPNRAEQAVLIVIVHIIAFLTATVQTNMTQVRLILMAPLVVAAVAVSQNNQQLALAEQISSPSSSSVVSEHDYENFPSRRQQQEQSSPSYHHYDYKTKLPRVEVQLLCSHDIRNDFDVSDTFRHFYQEFFLAALAHNDYDDHDDKGVEMSTRQSNVMIKDVDDGGSPFDTELFTFVSRSNVQDVKPREDFYDTCDPTSKTVLVTMDVRGYIHVRSNDAKTSIDVNLDGPLDGFHTQENLQQLIDQVNPTAVKDYFAEHVCSPAITDPAEHSSSSSSSRSSSSHRAIHSNTTGANATDPYSAMEYFKAKVRPWNTRLAPPPPSSSRDYPYPSTKDHKHFEHNLRLLCEGGVDAVYPNYHKQAWTGPESVSSLVVGILVGIIMVGMISREMNQKRQSSVRGRRRRLRGNFNDRSVSVMAGTNAGGTIPSAPQASGYSATPSDETEVV